MVSVRIRKFMRDYFLQIPNLFVLRFEQDLRMIKRKGTIVSYGNASGPVENVRLLQLTEKNIKVLRPT